MELILFIIALIALIIASFSDIKTREALDYLTHGLLIVTISSILILTIYNNTYDKLFMALIGLIITLIIGFSLYYLKQWGGADAKILFSLGALFGYLGLQYLTILLLLIVFIGAIYTFIWGVTHFCKEWKKAIKLLKKELTKSKIIRIFLFSILTLALISLFTPISYYIKGLIIITTFFLTLTYYLYIFSKTIESLKMIKQLPINSVTEGDWLAKPILNLKKKTLDRKDLLYLKQNKIKKLWIKVGIPFIPAITLAVLITIILYSMGLQLPLL
jgi:Flp pilus assembly protein protease CpaA